MPVVTVPPPYRGPTRGEGAIEVKEGTLRECLDAVEAEYPGFLPQVLDAAGQPHRFVKLFVNGEREHDLDARLAERDELEIITAIAGG